ncbi:MAG: hypothetical protein R3Y28_01355 [Candidatus Gastranaerophilales bacterium]
MKKIYITLSLAISLITNPAFAIDTIEDARLIPKDPKAPTWEEFCEDGYLHAEKDLDDNWSDIFSFVQAHKIKKNYWADRREHFEQYLASCNKMSDYNNRSTCYDHLRTQELNKNEHYSHERKKILYENNIKIHKYKN